MKEIELPLFESAEGSCFMVFAVLVMLQFDYMGFCCHNLLHIYVAHKYIKPFKGQSTALSISFVFYLLLPYQW